MDNRVEEVKQFILRLPDAKDYLFFWKGDVDDGMPYHATNEWLVGPFSGRSFKGHSYDEAVANLITYLDQHNGHPSMVGIAVNDSGWPNMNSVADYVWSRRKEDAEDQ